MSTSVVVRAQCKVLIRRSGLEQRELCWNRGSRVEHIVSTIPGLAIDTLACSNNARHGKLLEEEFSPWRRLFDTCWINHTANLVLYQTTASICRWYPLEHVKIVVA